ncbi:hemerythrin domain-containing protein [Dactylosporangium sp. NPDC048998]|uniref:hemerythrin domain-containing protein n=1 Tax=Dactylosporangium sp. NPDC048998 TaxID=3363976 RepID=UPI003714E264
MFDPQQRKGNITEDLVDVLLAQHARIEELFLLVAVGTGDARREAFAELVRLLALHEQAERQIVHPVAREVPGAGDLVVEDRLAEERQVGEVLEDLAGAGMDAPDFEEAVVRLREAALRHARYEERYEFPHLRRHVRPGRLLDLAAEVLDLQRRAATAA